jgi:hypothetical protein
MMIGRICRAGQTRPPKAYIIADPEFRGDKTAFTIKEERSIEDRLMTRRFKKRDFGALEIADRLTLPETEWNEEKAKERDLKFRKRPQEAQIERSRSTVGGSADNPLLISIGTGCDKNDPVIVS